jgi:GNAT superfamily N-acetyltransferase
MQIVIEDEPPLALREEILRPLLAYNLGEVPGWPAPANYALLLKDNAGKIVGGLWARIGFSWLFVELLFVPEGERGAGLGSKLMRMAEEEARRRHCVGVWLDSFTFQARHFYEKLGYEVFGALENYPEDHTRFFLRKRLGRAA